MVYIKRVQRFINTFKPGLQENVWLKLIKFAVADILKFEQ